MFRNKEKLLFVILSMMSILPLATSDIYLPSMFSVAQYLNVSISWVQSSINIYIFVLGISQFVFGLIADRMRFYKIFFLFMAFYLTGTIACIFSGNLIVFLLGRIMQAVGAAASLVAWQTCAIKLYDENKARSVISLLFILICISPGIAPVFGAYLTQIFNWQLCFIALFFYGTILCFLVYKIAPMFSFKLSLNVDYSKINNQIGLLFKNSDFIKYLLIISICYSGYLTYLIAYPVIAVKYGYSNVTGIGALFIPTAISFSLGVFFGRILAKKVSLDHVITVGLIFYTLSVLLLIMTYANNDHTLLIISLSFNLLMFGNGILLPESTTKAVSSVKEYASTAAGLIGSIRMTMAFVVTCFLNVIAHYYNISYVLFSLLFITSFIAWIFKLKAINA